MHRDGCEWAEALREHTRWDCFKSWMTTTSVQQHSIQMYSVLPDNNYEILELQTTTARDTAEKAIFAYSAVLNSCIWIGSKEFDAIPDRPCYCLTAGTKCYALLGTKWLFSHMTTSSTSLKHSYTFHTTHFSTRKCLQQMNRHSKKQTTTKKPQQQKVKN